MKIARLEVCLLSFFCVANSLCGTRQKAQSVLACSQMFEAFSGAHTTGPVQMQETHRDCGCLGEPRVADGRCARSDLRDAGAGVLLLHTQHQGLYSWPVCACVLSVPRFRITLSEPVHNQLWNHVCYNPHLRIPIVPQLLHLTRTRLFVTVFLPDSLVVGASTPKTAAPSTEWRSTGTAAVRSGWTRAARP